ncbi:MAG: GNAT family N-acetyltransferase [Acidimicrobiia bacterium]|nr:GNAT family N-acetyltransferase [Acidimicrobiia bacterium]
MPISSRLSSHLSSWLGAWPSDGPRSLIVTTSRRREQPGWDGNIRPVAGVATPEGAVLSVPKASVSAVRALGATLEEIAPKLGETVGRPDWRFYAGVFRWSETPIPFDRPGIWLPREDESVLPWLKPFNGDVLVGLDDGDVAAGVGRKLHDRWGHELAVVTEEGHRGRGWAKRLVSQAAERVLDDGAVPTYLHSPTNEVSARTADACGFPDRGWRILGIFPSDPGR